MLVIGGRSSSNSRKLYEICAESCKDTIFIQTSEDLDLSVPRSISKVGITAGASTPDIIIEEVKKKCQK
jgi:4-hydroxy-3-methylbut-2-enyl diphosphate reductase